MQAYESGKAIIVFVLVFFSLLQLRKLTINRLTKISATWQKQWGSALISRINAPLGGLILLAAFMAAVHFSFKTAVISPTAVFISKTALVVLTVWLIDRILAAYFFCGGLSETVTVTSRTLLMTISRLMFFSIALLVILDLLGISIVPILASLGIGSLAIALALQDTLSNFFSGIYLLIDKPLRTGDYVKVDANIEGYVRKIGWRSTHIQLPSGNMAVIPNSKLSSNYLINCDLPGKNAVASLHLTIGTDKDLDIVEQSTLSAAKKALEDAPEADPSFEPKISLDSLTTNATTARWQASVTLFFGVKHFTHVSAVRNGLLRAIKKRYQQDGIALT
ncbi:MAG: mechanosensitive ion channel domain-containing protein [Bdellovibrionota bacterium]